MLKKKSYERPREILVETLREILVGAQILRLLHKNRNWSNSSPSSGLRIARSLDKKLEKQKHGKLKQENRLYGIVLAVQNSSIGNLVTDSVTGVTFDFAMTTMTTLTTMPTMTTMTALTAMTTMSTMTIMTTMTTMTAMTTMPTMTTMTIVTYI